MKRRKFLVALGLVFPTFLLWGCGSDSGEAGSETDDDETVAASCTSGGAGVNYTNVTHAHTVMPLTQTELDNAVAGEYRLLDGDHSHMVSLTAQDFTDLQNGETLTKTSDTHGHSVDIVCA